MSTTTATRSTKKLSEYGIQLQEKQKLRNYYGLREKQFRRYFNEAAKHAGQTGQVLINILERRIDNVLYQSGLAQTRAQARQMINHRHLALNGRRVSIPSILVKAGDELRIVGRHRIATRPESIKFKWLSVDRKNKAIRINDEPLNTNELPLEEFDTQKVIEFYSR